MKVTGFTLGKYIEFQSHAHRNILRPRVLQISSTKKVDQLNFIFFKEYFSFNLLLKASVVQAKNQSSEISHKLPNLCPPQKIFHLARDLFILIDSVIICSHFENSQPPSSSKTTAAQEHVGHYTNKFTETGLDFFIKYLLRAI